MSDYMYIGDDALVAMLANDDNKAFEALYQRHAAALYATASRKFPVPHQVEDMLQEIFLTLYRKRKELGEVRNIRAYLQSALRNRILNEIRNSLLHEQHHQFAQESIQPETAGSYDLKLLEKQFQLALEKLTERSREVFLLSRRDKLSHKEIAEKLGISVKAVEKHMGKSLQVMRQEFKGYELGIALAMIITQQQV